MLIRTANGGDFFGSVCFYRQKILYFILCLIKIAIWFSVAEENEKLFPHVIYNHVHSATGKDTEEHRTGVSNDSRRKIRKYVMRRLYDLLALLEKWIRNILELNKRCIGIEWNSNREYTMDVLYICVMAHRLYKNLNNVTHLVTTFNDA